MTNRILLILRIIVLSVIVPCFIGSAIALAESPLEQLSQMVEQLQKTPGDNALREKIIRLVQELKPAPTLPEEAQATTPKPGESFRDCADCPEMVIIPPGSLAMGKTEVTQGQWRAVMGNNPSSFKNCGDNCPVENVSWNDAKDFIQKLNVKTGKQYRLPSETEWEYACRAGGQQEYCGSNNVDAVAWYEGNSNSTHPVAGKQPNAFGLYDMSGNVWEWVEDCYGGDCANRVLRGGSWYGKTALLLASHRFWFEPTHKHFNDGFRLALPVK